MGNQCTGEDQFQGESFGQSVPKGKEIFIQGKVPAVTQNPANFDDDDPIEGFSAGPLRYSQALINNSVERVHYDVKDNTEIKVAAESINSGKTVALVISILTKEMQYKKPDGSFCPRQGMDIICLIDHSGSMMGQKEKIVRDTLTYMLTFLQQNDRLCLIMFDCGVYRLTRLMRVTPANIEKFKIAINSIYAKGGTDIGNAMRMALSVLKHRKYKNPVAAILLLSDGEDDDAPETVRNDLQIYKIRDAFTIKTFGFGIDVCPRIMNEIAHMKEGQFYFVPNLNAIDICFVEALGGLVSVVANNFILSVNSAQGGKLKLNRAYGDKWQYNSWTGVYTLYQPHLLCGIRKDYVFEVNMNQDGLNQIQVKLQLDPIDGSQQIIIEKNVHVSCKNHDQEALENYYRVKGAECFDQAYQLAEAGQYQQAQRLLSQMQQQIKLQNFHDPMMDMLQNDLQTVYSQCTPGYYEVGGKHNLAQMHVVHMYQKSRGVQVVSTQNGEQIQCAYQNNIQADFKDQARLQKYQNTKQNLYQNQYGSQQQYQQQFGQQNNYNNNQYYSQNQQQQQQQQQYQQYQSSNYNYPGY